ncbi:hypothetical protein P5G63_13250 [Aeromonas salmonicida]|uniref:hypothetical protein n=1 Tax=Aeromonas salmonicida TaxID=645 RepID=UPI00223EA704|nr:hypothetical protein [Aeromonas salmonicida]MDF8329407.1 hypothetical protein [Aeromonas salmonicida]
MTDFLDLDDCDFHMEPSGEQFLLEAGRLWVDLKARNVTCRVDTLRKLVERRLETLPYDPTLKVPVDVLLVEKQGWGRCDFINRLY